MRIEALKHAANRMFYEFRIVGLFDIFGADALQYLAKKVELLIDVGVGSDSLIPARGVQNENAGTTDQHD